MVMKIYSAVIECCPQTGLLVGFVPGFPGAHSQGETLDEINRNLQEVITMLVEDGEPELEADCGYAKHCCCLSCGQYSGTQTPLRLPRCSSSLVFPRSAGLPQAVP